MRNLMATNIPFLSYRWVALAVSSVLVLGSVGLMLSGRGLNLGIDFVGGTQVTLKFVDEPDVDRLRAVLSGLEGDAVIQRFDEAEKNEVLIRLESTGDEGDFTATILDLLQAEYNPEISRGFDLNLRGRDELTDRLASADPESVGGDPEAREQHYRPITETVLGFRKTNGIFTSLDDLDRVDGLSAEVSGYLAGNTAVGAFSLLGAESVGPAVGSDLRAKATQAIAFSLVGMLLYIWIRFQLPYGIGAVMALFHDVLVTLGALALTQREINISTIAALLTLVGYSVNDTVVVFDRVRENLRMSRSGDLLSLMDQSINQTLSRTLITSGTTFAVVLCLFLFGGDVINTFAFVLMVGIIVGTYSSVFVASPVALWMTGALTGWRNRRASRRRRRR